MSCLFCNDRKQFATFRERFGGPDEVQYCPLCGTPVYIQDILDYLETELAKPLLETCTDEEGNILIVKRIPSEKHSESSSKPMDMGIHLDEINIDREVCMLEKANGGEAPWMTEYARERIREQIIEHLKEKGEKKNEY